MARLGKLEAERQNLAEAVIAAERKSAEEKRRADEFQQQVKMAKSGLESARQELVDYKQKATRILQVKQIYWIKIHTSPPFYLFKNKK